MTLAGSALAWTAIDYTDAWPVPLVGFRAAWGVWSFLLDEESD